MVNWCPPNSYTEDQIRCQHDTLHSQHTALMDMPVLSKKNGIVYQNLFCARCHNDYDFVDQFGSIECNLPVKNKTIEFIKLLKYHPKQRIWSGLVANALVKLENAAIETSYVNVICSVSSKYHVDESRLCIPNEIDFCPDYQKCPLYREIVIDKSEHIYKNYECAICNDLSTDDVDCKLSTYEENSTVNTIKYHFMNLSITQGDCKNKGESWNLENSICSDSECEIRNQSCDIHLNILLPKYARSHISFYCLTVTYRTNSIMILSNNDLYVNTTGEIYRYGEYELAPDDLVTVCHVTDSWTNTMTILSGTLIIISLVALFVHMAIFVLLPKRRNTPSKNLFSLSFSIFIVEFLYLTAFHANENYLFCYCVGVIFYYFLCSAFIWMNVLSIDICRTFTSKYFKIKPHKLFIQYSIYAWSVPMICATIAVSLNQLTPREFLITPSFGTHRCWFNNKWGLVTFFTFPAGIIVIINMILYGISVVHIYRQHREGMFASVTTHKNNSSNSESNQSGPPIITRPAPQALCTSDKHNSVLNLFKRESEVAFAIKIKEKMQKQMAAHRELKLRLVLYIKLAVIMGMTWIFAFISIHTKSYVFEYLFIVFNGLQGLFIFLAFDCKKKIWVEVRESIRNLCGGRYDLNKSSRNMNLSNLDSNSLHCRSVRRRDEVICDVIHVDLNPRPNQQESVI